MNSNAFIYLIQETLNKQNLKRTDFVNLMESLKNPYLVLVFCILSLRTKDETTYPAALRLFDLAKKDLLSESDPFIKIYLGDKLIKNESDKHQDDMKNCEWNQYYDIPCEMPGCGKLRIEVWDYDDLLSDDLIGATEIDLEDRFFDQKWQSLENKPIEIRPLIHPDESQPQGTISLWMEMFPSEERSDPKWDPKCIDKEPNIKYEARFVVWETEDMEMMDVEGTSDVYVLGYFNIKDKQSTDVHYRCQTGVASFNWRMLLPFETPALNNTLTIQAYDNDFFCSDDLICYQKLDISELIKIPSISTENENIENEDDPKNYSIQFEKHKKMGSCVCGENQFVRKFADTYKKNGRSQSGSGINTFENLKRQYNQIS